MINELLETAKAAANALPRGCNVDSVHISCGYGHIDDLVDIHIPTGDFCAIFEGRVIDNGEYYWSCESPVKGARIRCHVPNQKTVRPETITVPRSATPETA